MGNTEEEGRSVDWLILFPTERERMLATTFWPKDRFVVDPVVKGRSQTPVEVAIEIAGFGMVTSAVRTARMIEQYQPRFVLLTGIAGTYRDPSDVGKAFEFNQVLCYGIGIGTSQSFQPASQLGWPQWPGDHDRQSIGDALAIGVTGSIPETQSDRQSSRSDRHVLLTVPAASANEIDVRDKLICFPDATAEDMEGFSVAVACRMSGVPLSIIRGISNVAGDREKSRWQMAEAMKAAIELSEQKILKT